MRTTDNINICPYPGLRSFTEEESLYFKGRDQQVDQIAALLEKNKFLMVTGASGEGKSSLIYAGLIPNARAGFFRARYSNWVVASFSPGRSPVSNLANAVAAQFNQQPITVETELRRGFSSLIDLYTNSEFYTSEEDDLWGQLSDKEKKERTRKAANLIILVDQFEEFFTNPENFYDETPSTDSQVVINLILETARIAIKRNLPVYVVCTMRSDYIGQCTAFRGLPEYIGFSQFFVPRLKRKDLKQVIEEPAILSGNKISQRLIERLVFDIADGIDQLPILQHALTQIWLMADHGNEEMDLVHYAMTGGMASDDLTEEGREKFQKWFSTLPEYQQHFFANPGLNKVIEIHANTLYENAWDSYMQQHAADPITKREAKRIIAMTFSCLTKIDNSRAVRNRMNLAEITAIINSSKITSEIVGNVIDIYRKEGNSFIHPFITNDPGTHHLAEYTVLDITHESLIRNWNKLNVWANKEFEFYSTYLDFKKQLDRWSHSGKKRGYLLPLGPLTYFENWYKNCKPSAAWITRYLGTSENRDSVRRQAGKILNDAKEFLRKSARKETVSRAFMKYGPRRIATVFAIIIMLTLCGFYWYDADQKKNDVVLKKIQDESYLLLKNPEVNIDNKASWLLAEERFSPGSLSPYILKLKYKERIELSIAVYKQLVYYTKRQEKIALKDQLIGLIADGLNKPEIIADPEFALLENNKFLILLGMDKYYNPDAKKDEIFTSITDHNAEVALQFFKDKTLYRPEVPTELNMSIQMWLTFGHSSPEKITAFLKAISPFQGDTSQNIFNTYYAKGTMELNGRAPVDFNGGYHTLACLYAAAGEVKNVEWCFDKILKSGMQNYFELARLFNNHLNVIGYFYEFDHRGEVPEIIKWISTHTVDNPPHTILRNVVMRSGYISHMYPMNIEKTTDVFRSNRGYIYPNLYFCPRPVFDSMMVDYENAIKKITNPAERNFALAMNDKRKAMFYSKYCFERNLPVDETRLDSWLKEAIDLYSSINSDSLNAKESSTIIYNGDGVRTSFVTRRNLFIYPDYRDGWFSWTFHTDYFFNYLEKNNLLGKIYKTGADLQALHFWVAKAFEWKVDPPLDSWYKDFVLPDRALTDIISFVDQHPEGKQFDKNLLYLVLSDRAFERGDSVSGLKYYQQLDQPNLRRSADRYEYIEKIFIQNMIKRLCGHLAATGKMTDAMTMAKQFTSSNDKSIAFTHMAKKVYELNDDPSTFIYLDSAYASLRAYDFSLLTRFASDARFNFINLLSEIGSTTLNNMAQLQLLDLSEDAKFTGILARVGGVASEGNYYLAYTSIPRSLTETEDLQCRTTILMEACKAKEKKTGGDMQWKTMDDFADWDWNYINYQPN
ncbi:MAG TPA: ATP-binding protein [Puia sp.]|nr:ATP-binding protein [Puia sp.]